MVGLGRDLAQQTVGLPLVVERRVRQAQWHEIVDGIDIACPFGAQRQLVRAMQDVGWDIEIEIDEPAAPRKVPARIGEQVARDERIVMPRQSVRELLRYAGAGQIDRARRYPERAAQLIAGDVP